MKNNTVRIDGTRPRIGLALGGGAARGLAHVGVLRVLEEEGIRPDLVVGTSAGALAGAFVAARVSAARMAAWTEGLRWADLVRPVMSRNGLTTNERLGKFLKRALPVRTFDELHIPFACMATDLATMEPVLLCEGDLITALRASCAIPGLVAPVERDGRSLVDGGVTENVPATVTRLFGADLVIAVDVNRSYQHPKPAENMLTIVLRSFFTISRGAERLACERANIVIAPDIADIGVDELQRRDELVAAGERATLEALPKLRSMLDSAMVQTEKPSMPAIRAGAA